LFWSYFPTIVSLTFGTITGSLLVLGPESKPQPADRLAYPT